MAAKPQSQGIEAVPLTGCALYPCEASAALSVVFGKPAVSLAAFSNPNRRRNAWRKDRWLPLPDSGARLREESWTHLQLTSQLLGLSASCCVLCPGLVTAWCRVGVPQ